MKYFDYANILAKNFIKDRTVETTISEITSLFKCSERHTKTILNYLNHKNWIKWEVQRGRGRRPKITQLLDQEDIKLQEAIQFARVEQYQKAFAIVLQLQRNLQVNFQKWLQSNVGIFNTQSVDDEGLDILKYPFYETDLSLDPIYVQSRHDAHMVEQIYDRLVEFDSKTEQLLPKVAHHWETNDGKKWTFYLRKDVRFHHGKILTTQDVLTSIERINKNDVIWGSVESMEVLNPVVIIFHLMEVNFLFPRFLSNVKTSIIPMDVVESNEGDLLKHPIGSGPFRLVRDDQDVIQLEAFEQYYGYRPWLDRVEIIKVPEKLENLGDIPLMLYAPDNSWKKVIAQEEGADFIMFNCLKDGPMADEALRKWICHHIDAEEFCLSLEIVAHSFITERKQEIVSIPSVKDTGGLGKRLHLKIAVQEIRAGVNHEREALILQQQLRRIGIESTIEIVPFYQNSINDVVDQYDIFVGGIALSEDVLLSVMTAIQSKNVGIYPFLNNYMKSEVDKRISLINANKDSEIQWEMYFAMEEYLKENWAILFLNHRTHIVYESGSSPYMEIELDSHGRIDYRNVWKKIYVNRYPE